MYLLLMFVENGLYIVKLIGEAGVIFRDHYNTPDMALEAYRYLQQAFIR